MKKTLRLLVLPAALALAACSTTAPTNVHNDQRNCTHHCNIGSTSTGSPFYGAPTHVAPSYLAPPMYLNYGGTVIYHW